MTSINFDVPPEYPHVARILWYVPALIAWVMMVVNLIAGNGELAWRCMIAAFGCVMLSRGCDD